MRTLSVCSSHPGSRRRGRTLSLTVLLLVAAGFLFLTGCYEVDKEVITAADAVSISGLEGTYTSSTETMTISAVPHSHDYRFRSVTEKNVYRGYLRAMHLRDNIYLVQARYDGDSSYTLCFYRFTIDSKGDKRYRELQVDVSFERLLQLAKTHGIDLGMNEFAEDTLSGDREKILSFLLAHKAFSFQ